MTDFPNCEQCGSRYAYSEHEIVCADVLRPGMTADVVEVMFCVDCGYEGVRDCPELIAVLQAATVLSTEDDQ